MLHNAPDWAPTLLYFGIVAVLLGFGLTVWGYRKRDQPQHRD